MKYAAYAMSTPPPARIAIAGLSHDHVHWYFNRPARGDIQVVGVSELDPVLAQRYVRTRGLDPELLHSDLGAMLDSVKPQGVMAFGSVYDHLAVVEACAPRGIHVMVEKPLAVSLVDARQMKTLADQYHITLMVNYETTWYSTLYEAMDLVQADQIGPVRKVVVRDGHKGPKLINVSDEFFSWLTDPVQNGAGALIDFGCYGANLMTYIMHGARPLSVTAVTQHLQPTVYPKVDDEATIIVTYPSAQVVIQASWNWPISRKDMEIYGTRGYVITDNRSQLRVRTSEEAKEVTRTFPERTAPMDDPFAYFKALIAGEITPVAFNPSSLENNMLVMEILDAANRSAKTGRTIRL